MLNSLDQKDEAYQLARRGLKLNLKSHVCWHVLGLLYRSDRNYAEALKCYKSALRMDPGNAQILRDLSVLQLHQRDVSGYTETRRQLLAAKPGQKQNWLAFAVAEHLRGEHSLALGVLEKMDSIFQGSEEPMGKYERSELLLYRAYLSAESGQLDTALSVLDSKEIVDTVGRLELQVSLYIKQGQVGSCKPLLKQLLAINPSHEGYLLCLFAACGVLPKETAEEHGKRWLRLDQTGYDMSLEWTEKSSSDNETVSVSKGRSVTFPKASPAIVLRKISPKSDMFDRLKSIKSEYLGAHTKSDQFQLLLLLLLPSESPEFTHELTDFVKAKLEKAVPTAFKMLRVLYVQPHKAEIVSTVLINFSQDSSQDTSFNAHALMSLAHHYDFVGEFDAALENIEKAISVSPSSIDLYVLKAKVLKHLGNKQAASETWEIARKLDLADRYLNSKSVKALLRIGEIEKAKEIVMLFSKDSLTSTKSNLTDMQCMWWEFELGNALAAKGDKDAALQVWKDTKKHFDDMTEDEFDFAFYCLRKMTLRAYVDFLKLQDRLKSHKYYTRIANAIAAHE